MQIEVKTAGLLGRYLPPGSARNRAQVDVPHGATPAAVIKVLGMPSDGSYLVSLNGSVVPSSERERQRQPLSSGDILAIMPPLRGG